MSMNILDATEDQINRVTELAKDYRSGKAAWRIRSKWAPEQMENDVKTAKKALADGDTFKIVESYNKLKSYA